jgi:hypothetical protein
MFSSFTIPPSVSGLAIRVFDSGTLPYSHHGFHRFIISFITLHLTFSQIKTFRYDGRFDVEIQHRNRGLTLRVEESEGMFP